MLRGDSKNQLSQLNYVRLYLNVILRKPITMLSQLNHLQSQTDGRYASDAELQFVQDYLQTARLRFVTYQKIKLAEATIVQDVYDCLLTADPKLLRRGAEDLSAKWKRDTIRVLRFSATAMLLDDPAWLNERLLQWLATIMRAFGAQRSCAATYSAMQDVIRHYLSPEEAALFCPILALNQAVLGGESLVEIGV